MNFCTFRFTLLYISFRRLYKDYIKNDTGEDMEIKDQPAGWGSWGDYNLMSTDNNYFTEKAKTINNMR